MKSRKNPFFSSSVILIKISADPSLGEGVDFIPPEPSDVEDPSVGLTDGGLPSLGSIFEQTVIRCGVNFVLLT